MSSAGDFLNSVAVVVVIYRATGSAGWLGAAVFLRVVAWAVATAAGGVIGDRFDRRKVLVSLNIVAGIVALLLAVAASFDAAVVVVIVLATVLDFATGLVNPTFSAAVPAVVGEDDVAAANAAVSTVEQVSTVAGPALGALLIAVFSPELVFACNALSFAAAAAMFAGVAVGGHEVDAEGPPPRFRDGLAAVRSSRAVSVLLTIFVAAVFSYGFGLVLFVLVAVRRLGLDTEGVGYLRMAEGAGGVAAAVVAGRFAARSHAGVLVWAAVLTGAAPILLALTSSTPVALAFLALGGGACVVLEVIVVTWLQRVTPDELLGRVMGLLMSFGAVGTAAGALLAPVLERSIGLQWTLAFSGAVVIAVVLAVWPALPTVARDAARGRKQLAPYVDGLRSLGTLRGRRGPGLGTARGDSDGDPQGPGSHRDPGGGRGGQPVHRAHRRPRRVRRRSGWRHTAPDQHDRSQRLVRRDRAVGKPPSHRDGGNQDQCGPVVHPRRRLPRRVRDRFIAAGHRAVRNRGASPEHSVPSGNRHCGRPRRTNMSEPEGRANHRYGSFSFLATQWRAVIGAPC